MKGKRKQVKERTESKGKGREGGSREGKQGKIDKKTAKDWKGTRKERESIGKKRRGGG